MSVCLLAAVLVVGATGETSRDSVRTTIKAVVADDLDEVSVDVKSVYTPTVAIDEVTVVLAADRYGVDPSLLATSEKNLFPSGHDLGGFEEVVVRVDGQACTPRRTKLAAGETILACGGPSAEGQPIEVTISATLRVPDRFGPFGHRRRQLTLGGGWYPFVARPGAEPPRGFHRAEVRIPPRQGAVLGRQLFSPAPSGRVVIHEAENAVQIPLVILNPRLKPMSIAGGRVLVIADSVGDDPRKEAAEIAETVRDGLRFLHEEGLALPHSELPLLVVEAPLRHNLARATDGPVLVSDRAFRMVPFERFYRFHRFPILREMFTALALRGFPARPRWLAHFTADAIGAWLRDRYVASRFGTAEDAFDVLDLWAFIPAIDSMLYAPQVPFIGTYFRLIKEEDPLRPNLIDFPLALPRGKVIYEKLLDRLGRARTDLVFIRAVNGEPLIDGIRDALGPDADAFLDTWLGPYPDVRYRLGNISAQRSGEDYLVEVVVEREGAAIAEPVQVLLRDGEGEERLVWAEATSDPKRVVTATLGADLDLVEIDPFGRISETPTIPIPSPRFDNRSSPRWRFLINNFNILFSATAGTIDTALDVGLSRIRDVRWRHATRIDVAPETISLSGRSSYFFGDAITPDRLSQWIGIALAAEYLRPNFSGIEEDGYAFSSAIFYGYDERQTAWALESGSGVRLSLGYSRIFGRIVPGEALTNDAVSATARALHSWRLGGAHQITLRASTGAYLAGTPRGQLLFSIGGRRNVRGYDLGDALGRLRGIVSAEWVHPLIADIHVNGFLIAWATSVDGALYADAAVIGDNLEALGRTPMLADVGYGLRIYLDYFGVRPGVMSVDLAFPLVDLFGRATFGPPALYIDFSQSFWAF